MGSSGASNDSEDDGGRPADPATGVRKGRMGMGSMMRAASTKSFFARGKKSVGERSARQFGGLESSSNSLPADLASSFHSEGEASHDSGDNRCDPANHAALPFQEIGARMKAALKRLRQGGKAAEELKSNQRLSRRMRNSDPNIQVVLSEIARNPRVGLDKEKSPPMGYMQARAAYLTSSLARESPSTADNSALSSKLLEMTKKDNVCDIQIMGKDNVVVKAPSFLLACHSPVFEQLFFPKEESKENNDAQPPHSNGMFWCDSTNNVHIEFATESTIKAAIHFFATLELPSDTENEMSEANIRTVSQLSIFAQLFKVPSLSNATYQTGARLMNKMNSLACAAFDECNLLLNKAELDNETKLLMERQGSDNLRSYALDFLRDFPPNAGIAFFSSTSIEAIISDPEMDVDEYGVWRILNLWVNEATGTEEEKIATAKSLVHHIQLAYIDPIQLNYQLRKCGYISEADIEKALKQIDLMLANETTDDKERVIVEGAGDDRVNGVYVLHDDDIGLKADEVMYLKEGAGDDDLCNDFGLYRWGELWGISNCTDYFNLLYSCEVSHHKGHTLRKPPIWGWKCRDGADPAPNCTWKPSVKEENMNVAEIGFAPSLSDIKNEKRSGGRRTAHAHCGHSLNSSLTLSQMMSLPEDASFLEESYQYASAAKDLDAMMHLAVDEGHDDEEAGYDVNYMSATAFYDSVALDGVKSTADLKNPDGK